MKTAAPEASEAKRRRRNHERAHAATEPASAREAGDAAGMPRYLDGVGTRGAGGAGGGAPGPEGGAAAASPEGAEARTAEPGGSAAVASTAGIAPDGGSPGVQTRTEEVLERMPEPEPGEAGGRGSDAAPAGVGSDPVDPNAGEARHATAGPGARGAPAIPGDLDLEPGDRAEEERRGEAGVDGARPAPPSPELQEAPGGGGGPPGAGGGPGAPGSGGEDAGGGGGAGEGETGREEAGGEGVEQGESEAEGGAEGEAGGGPGDGGGGGGARAGAGEAAGGAGVDIPSDEALDALATGDVALIDQELAEHQRWGAAGDRVGAARSEDRAEFIVDQAGSGALGAFGEGFGTGALLGAGTQALEVGAARLVGRLAGPALARSFPLPGIGAVIGGVFSAYDLATRDWEQTGATIGRFGEGGSIYEQLANSIAAVSEIIGIATAVLNVIAGVIGAISIAMWVITVLTVGVASPLAATLSTIAAAIGIGTMILDAINAMVLQRLVTLFRALHTFTSQADPTDVEQQGARIGEAAAASAGFIGGMAGGLTGAGATGAASRRLGLGTDPPRVPDVEPPRASAGDGPTVTADPPPPSEAPRPGGDRPAIPPPEPAAPRPLPDGEAPRPLPDGEAPRPGPDVDPLAPTDPAPAPDTVDPGAPTPLPEGGGMPEIPPPPRVPEIEPLPDWGPELPDWTPGPSPHAPTEAPPALRPGEGPSSRRPSSTPPEPASAGTPDVDPVAPTERAPAPDVDPMAPTERAPAPEVDPLAPTEPAPAPRPADPELPPPLPDGETVPDIPPPPRVPEIEPLPDWGPELPDWTPGPSPHAPTELPAGPIPAEAQGAGRPSSAPREAAPAPRAQEPSSQPAPAVDPVPDVDPLAPTDPAPAPRPSDPDLPTPLPDDGGMPDIPPPPRVPRIDPLPDWGPELPDWTPGPSPHAPTDVPPAPLPSEAPPSRPPAPTPRPAIPPPDPVAPRTPTPEPPSSPAPEAPRPRGITDDQAPGAPRPRRITDDQAPGAPRSGDGGEARPFAGDDALRQEVEGLFQDQRVDPEYQDVPPPPVRARRPGDPPDPWRTQTPASVKASLRGRARTAFGRELQAALLDPGQHNPRTQRSLELLTDAQLDHVRATGRLPSDAPFHHLMGLADFPEFGHRPDTGLAMQEGQHAGMGHAHDPSAPLEAATFRDRAAETRPGLQEEPLAGPGRAPDEGRVAEGAETTGDLDQDLGIALPRRIAELRELARRRARRDPQEAARLRSEADRIEAALPELQARVEAASSTPSPSGGETGGALPVSEGSTRSTRGLTPEEFGELADMAVEMGVPRDQVYPVSSHTAYLPGLDVVVIGPDVNPLPAGQRPTGLANPANAALEPRAVLGHEVIGHREAELAGQARPPDAAREAAGLPGAGWQEEFQASTRAALHTPGLSREQMWLLTQDAAARRRFQDDPSETIFVDTERYGPGTGGDGQGRGGGGDRAGEGGGSPTVIVDPSLGQGSQGPSAGAAGPASTRPRAESQPATSPRSSPRTVSPSEAVGGASVGATGAGALRGRTEGLGGPGPDGAGGSGAAGGASAASTGSASGRSETGGRVGAVVGGALLGPGGVLVGQAVGEGVGRRMDDFERGFQRGGEPIVEPVNPAYPPPPGSGSRQDIADLQNRLLEILQARVQAEELEGMMARDAAHHEANAEPLSQYAQRTDQTVTANQALQAATARREAANQRKAQNEENVGGRLEDYATRAAGLAAITGPLRAFTRFTYLAHALPDDPAVLVGAKRGILRMNRDGQEFLDALDGVDLAVEEQRAGQPARKAGIEGDAGRIAATSATSTASGGQLASAAAEGRSVQSRNAARVADSRQRESRAASTGSRLDTQADETRSGISDLAAQWQSWAEAHRKARVDAMAATRKAMLAQGWQPREESQGVGGGP